MSTEQTPAQIAATPPPIPQTPAQIAAQGLPEALAAAITGRQAQNSDILESPPAGQPAPLQATPEVTPEATPEEKAEARYNAQLQALMSKARAAREQQLAGQGQQQDMELLQRIKLAKELGPQAALKALGLEPQRIDVSKLFGQPKEDDEPKSVKEIKEQVKQLNDYISSLKQQQEEEGARRQQEQQIGWERNELGQISQFIDTAKDKFEYVGAAKAIGSDKDIYNGLVSMYNQGYSPDYSEVADLVEARIEQLIDLVAPTKKFSDYIGKKFGVQLSKKAPSGMTLTGGMAAETPESVDLSKMTDEENRQYALKAAYAAKQEALRRLGAIGG